MLRGARRVEQLAAVEIRFDQPRVTRFEDFAVLGSGTGIAFLRSPYLLKQLLFERKPIVRARLHRSRTFEAIIAPPAVTGCAQRHTVLSRLIGLAGGSEPRLV